MLFRAIFIFTLASFFLSKSIVGEAAEVNTANYDIYIGDLNGDGTKDFLFKAKTFPIIIYGEISIPIIIARGVDFVIMRDGNSYKLPPVIVNNYDQTSIAALLARGTLRIATKGTDYELLSSTGESKLILKSNQIGVWNLLLVSSASTTLPIASINDPSSNTPPTAGTALYAWRGMIDGLIKNDPNTALQFFSLKAAPKYRQTFNLLGSQLPQIGNQLGTIEPLFISDVTAVYLAVKKGDDGSDGVYTVTFTKTSDGTWKIQEL